MSVLVLLIRDTKILTISFRIIETGHQGATHRTMKKV